MIKCYEFVSMATDEATSQFGSLWKVNENRQNDLKRNCELIDKLVKRYGGIAYDVNIDGITMEVSVEIEFDELIVDSKNSVFYELLVRAKRLKFESSGTNNLCIKLTFDSIWDKTI